MGGAGRLVTGRTWPLTPPRGEGASCAKWSGGAWLESTVPLGGPSCVGAEWALPSPASAAARLGPVGAEATATSTLGSPGLFSPRPRVSPSLRAASRPGTVGSLRPRGQSTCPERPPRDRAHSRPQMSAPALQTLQADGQPVSAARPEKRPPGPAPRGHLGGRRGQAEAARPRRTREPRRRLRALVCGAGPGRHGARAGLPQAHGERLSEASGRCGADRPGRLQSPGRREAQERRWRPGSAEGQRGSGAKPEAAMTGAAAGERHPQNLLAFQTRSVFDKTLQTSKTGREQRPPVRAVIGKKDTNRD